MFAEGGRRGAGGVLPPPPPAVPEPVTGGDGPPPPTPAVMLPRDPPGADPVTRPDPRPQAASCRLAAGRTRRGPP